MQRIKFAIKARQRWLKKAHNIRISVELNRIKVPKKAKWKQSNFCCYQSHYHGMAGRRYALWHNNVVLVVVGVIGGYDIDDDDIYTLEKQSCP